MLLIIFNINDIANKVRSALLTGLSLATGTAITATDSVLVAFGKLQKQITDLDSSKQSTAGLFSAVMALVLTGFSAGANTAVSATDTLAIALAKFQGQINARLTTISGIAAGGELSGTYPNPAVLNSAVLAKVLTGLNITGSSLAATDTLLEAFGKLQSQLNGVLGGAIYQGTWNATTNSPTLADGTGTKGHYYVVSVAGIRNLGSGNIDFAVGDWAIHNGAIYEKVDNTDAVSSVNGFIGAVNLTSADITEVTNLYFTNARAIAATLTGYSSGAGTVAATDTILQAIQKLNGNIAAIVSCTNANVAAVNHAANAKTTLVDTDEVTGQDSASSFSLIRTTWTSVKAFLKTHFDGLYAAKTFVENISLQDSSTGIAAQTYTLELYAVYAYTISELKIIADSGTCTAAVKIGSTAVTGISAVSVSTSIATGTATAANTVAVGDKITLVITSPSSLNNLQASLKTTRI